MRQRSSPDPPEPPEWVVLRRVRIPLRRPHTSATQREVEREVVVVEWRDRYDGTGWSECSTLSSPGYVTETTDEAWRALVDTLVPAAIAGVTPDAGHHVASVGALRDAELDARLRRSATSLASHLGATRSTLDRCAVLASVGASSTELVDEACRAVDDGAAMVKVKVRPGADVHVLDAVLAAVGVPVAADANGTYRSPAEVADVDRLGLAYLEQPFAPMAGLERLAEWTAALVTPVALDESLGSVADVEAAVSLGAARVVSVKPARLGGVEQAAEAVAAAVRGGASAFVGGMLELGLGRASSAAVAALEGCDLPTDLGPSSWYVATDICEEIRCDHIGRLVVPDGPGIGRVPSPEALDAATVDLVTCA